MSERARDEESRSSKEDFGIDAVRELLLLINNSDITELKIERGDTKFHIKRGMTVQQQAASIATAVAAAAPNAGAPAASFHPQVAFHATSAPASGPENELELAPGSQIISAPMVGTFYSASSPKDPILVREGDAVQVGDVVGIVEAMKIMNEIDSEYAGKVTKIFVSNGQPVEYGQPLMVVEPM